MKIAGLQKNSLVDYRGKVAAVVFAPFCNFDCYYCHNRMLLENDSSKFRYVPVEEEDFFKFLDKRIGLLHGVVITGGEPTLQKDLPEFIKKIRSKGFPVKLDTNGSNPKMLEQLINADLIDALAMDIKAPFEKYDEICGVKVDHDNVRRSINIVLGSKIDYEFRTTVTPELTLDDIRSIAKIADGCSILTLQQFRRPENYGGFADIRNAKKPHTKDFFEQAVRICDSHADKVLTRGVNI